MKLENQSYINDTVRIGNVEIRGRLTLAPMAGVSDFAFRKICREQGAALAVTEMISAKALVFGDKKTEQLLYIPEDEGPVSAQIFGHEPETMAQAAEIALDISGADIIDVNFGCPVGKIVHAGDGSAIMKTPELAGEIISAITARVKVPVTAKFRKGFDGGSVNAVEFAKICEAAGASALAVHGRTRAQLYSGRADWDIIREVKKAVKIPVFANGDVFSYSDAEHILEYTGADFAMVGRGSFGNPWVFNEETGKGLKPEPDVKEKLETALRQTEMLAENRGEYYACLESRHFASWYLHGVAHSSYYRQQLVKTESLEQMKKTINSAIKDLA